MHSGEPALQTNGDDCFPSILGDLGSHRALGNREVLVCFLWSQRKFCVQWSLVHSDVNRLLFFVVSPFPVEDSHLEQF